MKRHVVRGPRSTGAWSIRGAVMVGARHAASLIVVGIGASCLAPAYAQDAATLRARHVSLRARLADNQFHEPLFVESTQTKNDLRGDVYAVIDEPFSVVAPALRGMDRWCDVFILHLNVKHCSGTGVPPGELLRLSVGSKHDQSLEDAYPVDFKFNVAILDDDYLKVRMTAETGPFRTRNYRLSLEAVRLDERSSFVHLSYSYGYGMAARAAMRAYLSTVGRKKVGFSIVGKTAEGRPIYVDGVRAVVERNAMRYYLAIESYLGAVSSPPERRLEKRLWDWYAAVERFPLQLHELERGEYLDMKRREVSRQQATARGSRASKPVRDEVGHGSSRDGR